jgi:hypothetical protein
MTTAAARPTWRSDLHAGWAITGARGHPTVEHLEPNGQGIATRGIPPARFQPEHVIFVRSRTTKRHQQAVITSDVATDVEVPNRPAVSLVHQPFSTSDCHLPP